MPSASRSFPPAPESVGRARSFATRTLASWGAGHLEDDVRVVASELATNALLHARTEFTLRLALDGDRLRVTLADGSVAQPRVRRFDSTESTTGRGLRMVAELAQAWGVELDGVGKAVWCEFSVATGSGTRQRADVERDSAEDVESLLALYADDDDDDDDDDDVDRDGDDSRPQVSRWGTPTPQLLVRVVA